MRRVNKEKRCFRYCGDDKCDCSSHPRKLGLKMLARLRKQNARMTKAELQEMEYLNGSEI